MSAPPAPVSVADGAVPAPLPRTRLRPSRWTPDERLAAGFAAAAVLLRLAFWIYTRRTWEDALITLAPARNVWLGNGLTHHVTEPAVHSFTSPIGVLVLLAGEAVGEGLLAIRLASLAAAAATIVVAHLLAEHLDLGRAPRVFLFTYLAADQLQIFFGMAGMETQLATLILLVGVLLLLRRRWTALGALCGLGLLARPEFVLWVAAAGVAVVVQQRRAVLRWAVACAAVAAPWFVFATAYYGSPVPHTIVAKSLYDGGVFRVPGRDEVTSYLSAWWEAIAPFESWAFAERTPVPRAVLLATALVFLGLGLFGVWKARRSHPGLAAVAAFVAAFFAYRTWALITTYAMWYLPPVVAAAAVTVAVGLDHLRRAAPRPAAVLGGALAVLFALHVPFSFPIERRVQRDVELGVRDRVGRLLAGRMTAQDTVGLEPLGYVGHAVFNRTIYDYPGLGSETVTDALRRLPPSERTLVGMIDRLRPTFLVLRDHEIEWLEERYPEAARLYRTVGVVKARADLDLDQWGLSYFNVDTRFTLLERRRAPG